MNISHWHRAKLRLALRLLSELYGIDQQTLVERSGKKFSAADLSRAKNGELGLKRWNAIGEVIAEVAGSGASTSTADTRALITLAQDLRADAPDSELERAYVAEECLFTINAPLWGKTPNCTTTPLQGVLGPATLASMDMQRSLKDEITRLHQDVPLRENPYSHLSFVPDTDYSSVLNWTRCRSFPLLLLFPFFLTAERRMSWGVIPYAMHRCVGLLLPRYTMSPGGADGTLSPEEFMAHIDRHELTVYSLAGYVEEQVIFEMALEAGESSLRLIERSLRASRDATFSEVFQQLEADQSCLLFGLERLSDIQTFVNQSGRQQDFRFVKLYHEINVPTGIGFSLPAIPWLEAGHRFSALQRAALELARQSREHFLSVGIEVR